MLSIYMYCLKICPYFSSLVYFSEDFGFADFSSSPAHLWKRPRYNSSQCTSTRAWTLWCKFWSWRWPDSTVAFAQNERCLCQWNPCEDQILWYLHAISPPPLFTLLNLQQLCGTVWPPLPLGRAVHWAGKLIYPWKFVWIGWSYAFCSCGPKF